ncbi:MAG: flagellar filament capping protein FliD [Treponema sp.]|jgi:flagellar hook-associated protein 2|nr:flagellar filament capping protein FliD [Treponema sp.]
MSDIYVPGIKSRFNTEIIVEDLMKVERIPRDRAEKDIETFQTQKTYWQDIGRRVNSLRESSRVLYSFQNPFNERIARSSDETVLSGIATRQAVEQERSFTVKQVAKADRFLSQPLDTSYKVDAGNYGFRVGDTELSLAFRGGTLKEFAEAVNRRGREKIQASVITVTPGTQSLLIESLVTGAGNRLRFSGASEDFAFGIGMGSRRVDSTRLIQEESVTVPAGSSVSLPSAIADEAAGTGENDGMVLSLETSTKLRPQDQIPSAPQGPAIPPGGSVSYGGVTIENDSSSVPIPAWSPPPVPVRVDDMAMLSLKFTDGSSASLPLVRDSGEFIKSEYPLSDIAGGKTVSSVEITNNNTHRDVSIRNVMIFDPEAVGDFHPKNAVSTAQDAIVEMEGIEIRRPSNNIDDLLPGVTVIAKAPSDYPVRLTIEPDREAVKESIISLVGNYNRLAAELNVLTRKDDRIVQELSYLAAEEQADMREKLGVFSGETGLSQFKNTMQRAVTGPYPTSAGQELTLLAQIGIGTDVRRAGSSSGYDASRLRGYLEIDEKALDAALAGSLPAIQQLFGSDTDGDLVIDSGVAYALDTLTRPYVETGGIVSLKTGTLDSKINQEQRRIATLDRQLEAKEASLKKQYGQVEGAFTRMERMSDSLDQLGQRMQSINNR